MFRGDTQDQNCPGYPSYAPRISGCFFFSILHCFACRTKSEGLILERYRLNLFALNWNVVCFPERAQAQPSRNPTKVIYPKITQPVREAVSYRGLFTAGWFDVREKHYSRLKIYDRLRANEQPDYLETSMSLCRSQILVMSITIIYVTCTQIIGRLLK